LSASLSPEEKTVILAGFDRIRYRYVNDGYAEDYSDVAVYLLAGVFGHQNLPLRYVVQLASDWSLNPEWC